jgi:hypothetical protein
MVAVKTAQRKRSRSADGDPVRASVRYEREEWTLFRSVRTISQVSGVSPEKLRRLIAKELVDNALDTGGRCTVGELPDGGFFVEDDGPGISGDPRDIARLFSFRRPLVSSKVKRGPTRGALGNGLRVVAGTVYASGGRLRVITDGRMLDLMPHVSGETRARVKQCDRGTGTRVEVYLGNAIPEDAKCLEWAKTAISAVGKAPIYVGKTSPWWHDSDSFFELLDAAGSRTVHDVLQDFDGCHEPAGPRAAQLLSRRAATLTYEEAEDLLESARSACDSVSSDQLVPLGAWLPGKHAKALGVLDLDAGRGRLSAKLPYTVEAWCEPSTDGKDHVVMLVNRTPVTGDVEIQRTGEKTEVAIFGCNLADRFTVGKKPIGLTINVQIPYMPITSNGKEPDLGLVISDLYEVIEKAARKCQRANPTNQIQLNGLLPSRPKGRPNSDQEARYAADLGRFADLLKKIESRIDFKVSSRGWCYILENEHKLEKGAFEKAQRLINDCRKNGLLPIDFTVEDEARTADLLERCDDPDPTRHAAVLADLLGKWQDYSPVSFWDNQPVFIQMVVEKIDLKYLFLPICQQYRVPLINSRGWSDLNLRAALMRRFQEHERKGRQPVLLTCGDHDPGGLEIADSLPRLLEELERAVGWSPRNLIVERFGLNADFIEQNNLTWIDGLQTASGKDLSDPSHRHHNAAFVRGYIEKFGKRKVEANALVVRPEAGRQLCKEAIEKYLDMGAIAAYERSLVDHRECLKQALPEAVNQFLRDLG